MTWRLVRLCLKTLVIVQIISSCTYWSYLDELDEICRYELEYYEITVLPLHTYIVGRNRGDRLF